MIHFVPILGTGESLFGVSEKSHHGKQRQKRSPETDKGESQGTLVPLSLHSVLSESRAWRLQSSINPGKVKPAIITTPLILFLQATQFCRPEVVTFTSATDTDYL